MDQPDAPSLKHRAKKALLGGARSPQDPHIFHKLSLIAFFAWVGLGADGLSSSCYGPEEAFLALSGHFHLGILVALASVVTIFIISASYSQIVELFPSGGGGYLVASKLLSPKVGMISGCALLIDYVLTITLSVASGADAIFSFLPISFLQYKLMFAMAGVLLLIWLNLRGVKESVVPLVPIFIIFVITHVFAIVYGMFIHAQDVPVLIQTTVQDIRRTNSELGTIGTLLLLMRAYSMGAGTYTGIEAVSNGMPILREPKVETAKSTMRYMAFSLAFMVLGLMVGYTLFRVEHVPGKTLNAVLMDTLTQSWNKELAYVFVLVTLVSEAVLLFVASQTGFLDGPRVLSNMALDRWFPSRFATLSDRLVTQNGILLMGGASMILMFLSKGSVRFMVVLYSINVFITFFLSQLGMVRYWWSHRKSGIKWRNKLLINGVGMGLTGFILISVSTLKFSEGGWITVLVTGSLVLIAFLIKRHYTKTGILLKRLDGLVEAAKLSIQNLHREGEKSHHVPKAPFAKSRTAVIMTNGFNGLGLHTLFGAIQLFGDEVKNFVFMQVGVVDAGVFKSSEEVQLLKQNVDDELDRYVSFMQAQGYYAKGISALGIDVVDEVAKLAPEILQEFPKAVFFGGQLVFPQEPMFSRWLHNYTVFSIQRRFYYQGIPLVMLPIRVQ
jgi:amino acid transporter